MQRKKKFTSTTIFKTLCTTLILVFFSQLSFSQIADIDKIDASTARTRKDKFHGQFGGKKALPHAVIFNVDELQEVLDAYKAANVKEIPFVFAMIRPEDSDKYASKRHMNDYDKDKINNQPTLLIKGPPDGSASLKRMNFASFYYDIGSICPPPGSCVE